MPIGAVSRELLVRYLDTWVPSALHGSRRATFAQIWHGDADIEGADASLRVFAEFSDRMRGCRTTMVFIAPRLGALQDRLDRVQAELKTPPDLAVHVIAGDPGVTLKPALVAAQAAGAPLFVYADCDIPPPMDSLVGQPKEAMLATMPGRCDELAAALRETGCPLVSAVDFVSEALARQFFFATTQMKHLEAFKNAIWQLDEYAGVQVRDPNDIEGKLLDITLNPSLGPLRRELTAHLGAVGQRSVTEIRQFALTETVYRAQDVTGALSALITSGSLTREPGHGRLAGDTLIRPI